MSDAEIDILTKAVLQITLITTVFVALFLFVLRLSKTLMMIIDRKRVVLKLKKYELQNYNIYFDSKGMPVTLVNKDNNKIIFIWELNWV